MSLTAVIPLYPGFDSLDVMGPLQAFLYGGIVTTLAAQDCGGVTSLEGVTIHVTESFDSPTQYDILFVPGGDDIPSVLDGGPRGANPYLNYLTRQAQGAKLVCSVCTGSLLLGAADLLDGHTATTHWNRRSAVYHRHHGRARRGAAGAALHAISSAARRQLRRSEPARRTGHTESPIHDPGSVARRRHAGESAAMARTARVRCELLNAHRRQCRGAMLDQLRLS